MTTKLEKLLYRLASLQKENADLKRELKQLRKYLVVAADKMADLDDEIDKKEQEIIEMKAGENI